MRPPRSQLLLGVLWLAAFVSACQGRDMRVGGLKCEYRTNPLGIDAAQPRLSWVLDSDERGQSQTGYQVLCSTTLDQLAKGQGDLWDSGKVLSRRSLHVVYDGKPLRSGQRVYWNVRAWDKDGKPTLFSQPAWWEMGLLVPGDWQATWITRARQRALSEEEMFNDDPVPLFRREFTVEKKIKCARVYISGLGYYELRLNGERVGNHVLDPGWTTYSKRVLYSTYDVTKHVQQGSNALAVILGNGWFNPLPLRLWGHINPREHLTVGEPRVILQLLLDFADGSSHTIASDQTWKASQGPILRNNLYLGEVYDARKEQPGWDRPGFSDSTWSQAVVATEPLGSLHAQDAPPIRITRTLKPVELTEPKPGVFIFDMGQNYAGWVRLRVRGPAGTRVRMRYGELLYPDGTLNGMTAVCGQIKQGGPSYVHGGSGVPKTAFQIDEYVLKGEGEEVYSPRFTFHGFRYVEVTGFPGKPTLETIEGLRLNSDVAPAGSFECSNERLNRIQKMVLWTELSNLFSVESDCPHREKFGYGGDIVAASEMAMLNFDMSRFYAKAVEDLADAVRPNGGFTETSPFVGISDQGLGDQSGPIGWGTAHPLLVWQLHQYYGDQRMLEEQHAALKRWIALLQSRATEGILDNGISDHESLVPKPRALTGTAFYYLNVNLLARIAETLDRTNDAAEARALAEQIKTAFNKRFLNPDTGRYDTGTQACQAFALYMGLVTVQEKERALEVLVRDIVEAHKGHLSTGIFGTKYMLNTLTDLGRADVAYQVVNQRTFPGWGHMLENGATTLWEHWEFSDNTYSHNHPMFGSVSEWFYKALAGINPAPDAVGFDRIIIKPQPVGDVKWVKASYDSVRGKIVSEWKREEGWFELQARIPVGVTARVSLTAKDKGQVMEGGELIGRAKGVEFRGMEEGRVVLEVGSGSYKFVVRKTPGSGALFH